MGRDDRAEGHAGEGDVTRLLRRVSGGDKAAQRELLAIVYDELRGRARRAMRRQRRDHTLQPTALVHEVFLKLGLEEVEWADRAHFFATAALAMQQILTDHAKGKLRAKRGGGRTRVPLDAQSAVSEGVEFDPEPLRAALVELARIDPRAARVVELRFLHGMTLASVAEKLGISPKTAWLDWEFGRAWLAERLGDDETGMG